MTPSTPMLESLRWRYATKVFDASRSIPEGDLEEILEALRLSPSSFGLQPWKFLVVSDRALREGLVQHAWGQRQIVDSSHLVVLCARREMDATYVGEFVQSIAEQRGVPADTLKAYSDMMLTAVSSRSPEALTDWASRQVYIALGFLLFACAEKRIDACPMEGFDAAAFDKALGLEGTPWRSVALCAMGYRSDADHHAKAAKVRFPATSVIDKR